MVCYGCGIDLHGYQAYKSLFCSQCLNRRAVEEQTRTQARIAERQLELQREQLEQFEEQRELTESRRYAQAPVVRQQPKKRPARPLAVIEEEMARTGGLPDMDEYSEAIDVADRDVGSFVRSITESDSGKNARSYREIMNEYHNDPDGNLPDLTELITAALAHKKKISEGYESAVALAKDTGTVSISKIQRHLGTGYADTVEIINEMELNGVISEGDTSGVRQVVAD